MGVISVPMATAAYHRDDGWLPQTIGYNARSFSEIAVVEALSVFGSQPSVHRK